MDDPLPGSKEALEREERFRRERERRRIEREARRQHPAAALYDPDLPLPSAVEMERCALSALMQAPDFAMEIIGSKLKPEHFSIEAHSLLWELLIRHLNAGKPVDPETITLTARDQGLLEKMGGPAFVSEIYTAAPNPAHAEFYALQVHEKYRQRQGVAHASTFLTTLMLGIEPEELPGLIGDLQSNLMRIEQESLNTTRGLRTGEEVLIETMDRMLLRHKNKGKILGLQFGFPDIDRRVNGFQRGDFIVIGARPAMGKTSLGTTFAQNVAMEAVNRENRPVLMFTLEMGDTQIMERTLLGKARIDMGKARTGLFSDAEASVLYAAQESLATTRGQPAAVRLQDLIETSVMMHDAYCAKKGKFDKMEVKQLDAYIDKARKQIEAFAGAVTAVASGLMSFYDGYGVTVQELRSKMREWIRKIRWTRDSNELVPPMVVVDYLQLVKASLKSNMGDPRLTSIEVCEALKGFAKETGIVILGLAQVKVNDKRPEAEPQLSDIKESGAFGEYPDYVFTIHRASYYKRWKHLKQEVKDDWEKRAGAARKAREASGLSMEQWGGEAFYTGATKIGIKKARFCRTDDVYAFFRGDEVRFVPITTKLFSNSDDEREDNDDDGD